jgi:lipoyl-dependent peroxiredoxin
MRVMKTLDNVLYTARTHTTGGRDGASRSSDGRLDIQLSSPGGPGTGTNPEQLFAAGWSACFIGALRLAASRLKVQLPVSLAIDAEVALGTAGGEYGLAARLKVSLPGIAPDLARQLISSAHENCPYSRATRGNIAVDIQVA